MIWHLESEEGRVEAVIFFKDGVWNQKGLNPDILEGEIGLADGKKVRASDGLAFLAGLKRVLEPSGLKFVEGEKELSPPEDIPEWDPNSFEESS